MPSQAECDPTPKTYCANTCGFNFFKKLKN